MKKMITMILIFVFLCCVCTGCGDGGVDPVSLDQPYNVALVTAIANNNPVFDTGIDELARLPEISGSTYSCILADSTPHVICDGTVPDFSDRGFTEDMLKRAQASIAADIVAQLDEAMPDSPEVDIAGAASLAVRTLHANAVDGRDNILIFYCSGISTSGLINMTEVPVYKLDVESSVETLSDLLDFNLSGIQVVWYCCGDVAGYDQSVLSENEKKILKSFYETLFMKMGAETVKFMEDVPQDGCYSFEQKVSVMETEGTVSGLKEMVVSFEDVVSENAAENGSDESVAEALDEVFTGGEILSFDETSIAFKPDSTELIAPEDAMDALSYVIDYMDSHPDFNLLICGTTTSAGEKDFSIHLSEKRADTIRNILINDAGIDADRIYTLGCGWSSCLYTNDRAEDGTLNENAPLNRSVKLVGYDSETAAKIISSLNAQ